MSDGAAADTLSRHIHKEVLLMRKPTLVAALAALLAITTANAAAAHPFDRDGGWPT